MGFEYSCFISYRHGGLTECVKRLKSDIEARLKMDSPKPLPIFMDETGMRAGDLLDPKLARVLCKSAVFVMAYQPTYFDKNSVWCTQEFVAFLGHEKRRLDEIKTKKPNAALDEYHQIISVAFSDDPKYNKIPAEVNKRLYENWSSDFISTNWNDFVKEQKYLKFVKTVVDRIKKIQIGLSQEGIKKLDILTECNLHGSNLPLPADPQCKKFIKENWKPTFPI
ncbi:MAG: toll/interleukin-1 receptor domain-containing protein [Lewinellaceae bacterium]|nr:toll/interleukin-1 receptor domain-containing protein [Lewinellaceae bacterium]